LPSHLGYQYKDNPEKICDTKLAALTKDIDLIIGGHTHTFLDKPTVLKNTEGIDVLVNQVGCYGVNLGRIDFYFEKGKPPQPKAGLSSSREPFVFWLSEITTNL
jgi:5'-nucleotidase